MGKGGELVDGYGKVSKELWERPWLGAAVDRRRFMSRGRATSPGHRWVLHVPGTFGRPRDMAARRPRDLVGQRPRDIPDALSPIFDPRAPSWYNVLPPRKPVLLVVG